MDHSILKIGAGLTGAGIVAFVIDHKMVEIEHGLFKLRGKVSEALDSLCETGPYSHFNQD